MCPVCQAVLWNLGKKPPFLLYPEVGSTIILRNDWNYPPIDTELYPTFFLMPPPLLMNCVVFHPGCGDSVADFWGWGALRKSDVQMTTVQYPLSTTTQRQFVEQDTNWHGDYWKQRRLSYVVIICNRQHIILSFCNKLNTANCNYNPYIWYP